MSTSRRINLRAQGPADDPAVQAAIEALQNGDFAGALKIVESLAGEMSGPAIAARARKLGLNARQSELCARNRIDPKAFAETRAHMQRGQVKAQTRSNVERIALDHRGGKTQVLRFGLGTRVA